MKKFLISVIFLLGSTFLGYIAYFYMGYYVDLRPEQPITSFMKVGEATIYMKQEGEFLPFEIRGVDMGVGLPGEWATDFAIDEETYLRWFAYIQEMGANTIRVYTILHDDFYNAFYLYNQGNEHPLYLLHGLWVKDYKLNSHQDAFVPEFREVLLNDSKTLVDVLHGNKSVSLGGEFGSGQYRKDISPWVIGYIIGVEWEPEIVIYTNQIWQGKNSYQGKFLFTTEGASPFEILLCEVGDKLIEYETNRYKQQRLLAFSNWPTTDPFVYPPIVTLHFRKMATVDVEQIKSTELFLAGQFASYHVYPYFPDYFGVQMEGEAFNQEELTEDFGIMLYKSSEYRVAQLKGPRLEDFTQPEDLYDTTGQLNTYLAYLRLLNRYHSMPVVISEYGVTTGRGRAQVDRNTERHQGFMSELEQGQAVIDCYQDIIEAGSAGSCVFTWQDEWFKRTWNTMYAVDLDKTPYWSDTQTNEQYFGLLTFDPGKEESICYVDGNTDEWKEEDLVTREYGMEISQKQDEKYVYFLIEKENWNPEDSTLWIPLDITPKTGSTYCAELDVDFQRPVDYLIQINGRDNSFVLVQERYDTLRAAFGQEYYKEDFYANPPAIDTPHFTEKLLPLILSNALTRLDNSQPGGVSFDTGRLTYGIADPNSSEFNSLADFHFSENGVEIRLPWQLLNFSNPSEMQIHDDYFVNYGIENLSIKEIYIGAALKEETEYRIRMASIALQPWHHKVEAHERLKESYYLLKDYWLSHPVR